MSLQYAANYLAGQGRGPDTTLVHMGQGEVNALQGLARATGGSLTTNPQTGLPEAGFLSSILPMLAGAAGAVAAPFTGGVINPWTASLLVGGITGAATGSLSKGLMAGLGAYGGYGLAGSLGVAGAAPEALKTAVPEALKTAVPEALKTAVPEAVTGATSFPVSSGVANFTDLASASPEVEVAGNSFNAAGGNGGPFGLNAASEGNAFALKGAPLTYDNGVQSYGALGKGAMPLGAGYDTGVAKALSATGATPASLASAPVAAPTVAAAAPVNAAAAAQSANEAAFKAMSPMDRMSAMGRGATFENVGNWASANKPQALGLAAPFIADMAKVKQPKYKEDTDVGTQYAFERGAANPTPTPSPTGIEQNYYPNMRYRALAGGGLSSAQSHLGDYSDGGRLLRGPGDGVSDSIPATIGGRQPARLADGEFVVPARIVSELGNGSTEAGAKQLYAMMNRIQNARRKTTGAKQVAAKTNAKRMLPA